MVEDLRAISVGPTRQSVTQRGRHRTSAVIRYGRGPKPMFVVTDGDIPFVKYDKGDIWLPGALILAMRRGLPLVVADPISDARRAALDAIQDLFLSWYPERMHRVEVEAPLSDAPTGLTRVGLGLRGRMRPRREGSCFTGGVDSFYSRLTNEGVNTIVYALGLDIPLDQEPAAQRVQADLRQISDEMGDRLIFVRTNLREVFRRRVFWGYELHGAVLASLGEVLTPVLSTLRIPATHTDDAGIPWGSHPKLDPLWSTGRLQVVHDGASASRAAKTMRLARDPLAQKHLRVCYVQFRERNCGKCMKCMRTMATLALSGQLEKFRTFEVPLDLDRLRGQTLRTPNDVFQIRDALSYADTVSGRDDVKGALRSLVQAYEDRELAEKGEGPLAGTGAT